MAPGRSPRPTPSPSGLSAAEDACCVHTQRERRTTRGKGVQAAAEPESAHPEPKGGQDRSHQGAAALGHVRGQRGPGLPSRPAPGAMLRVLRAELLLVLHCVLTAGGRIPGLHPLLCRRQPGGSRAQRCCQAGGAGAAGGPRRPVLGGGRGLGRGLRLPPRGLTAVSACRCDLGGPRLPWRSETGNKSTCADRDSTAGKPGEAQKREAAKTKTTAPASRRAGHKDGQTDGRRKEPRPARGAGREHWQAGALR